MPRRALPDVFSQARLPSPSRCPANRDWPRHLTALSAPIRPKILCRLLARQTSGRQASCLLVEIEAGPVERRYGGQAKDRPPGSRGLSAIAFAEKLADGGALMEGAAVLDGHVGRVHDHSRLCLACERGCYWPGQQ